MDFDISEDQGAIAEMAGSVFADYCTDDRLRQFDTSEQAYAAAVGTVRGNRPASPGHP